MKIWLSDKGVGDSRGVPKRLKPPQPAPAMTPGENSRSIFPAPSSASKMETDLES